MKYIKEGIQKPPKPHIMFIGPRGSGISTQIEKICAKYEIPCFNIKEAFLKKLEENKQERKKQRLLTRGFKPPEPVEDEDEEPPPDPEIEDEPEGFEPEVEERAVMRSIIDTDSALIIDGDWFDLPEETITLGFGELLFESRRPPEMIINLTVSEENMLNRLLDNDAIEAQYQELVDKRNEEKRLKREEDRAAKLAELKEDEEKTPEEIEEEMKQWDEERDEEEKDEDDPEAPNLQAMLDEQKEKLIESRTTQVDFLEEFKEKIAEKKVPLFTINGDLDDNRVNLRILD
jgi:adenylate kinase family enzyme